MPITIARTLSEEEWRRYVEEHPAGNVFHTPEMFQVFHRTKGYQPELWAATKDGRVLALLLPMQVTLMNGLVLRGITTRSIVYGSVLCESDAEGQEALVRLLRTYTHQVDGKSLFTELRNLSSMEVFQSILGKCGFIYEDHLNYLIDLERPSDTIMKDIKRQTRKRIRKGLRDSAVVIEEVTERKQVAICYDLLCQSYRMANVPLADCSLFEGAFDLLYPKNMVRFTLARVNETPIAVSVDLLYKNIMYGWYGGVNRDYSSYVPNELLTWHILQWGAENGYHLYDFGGAGKPDEEYGVRDFKSKFGGELVCYGRNIHIHSPFLLRLSKLGYRVFRRML